MNPNLDQLFRENISFVVVVVVRIDLLVLCNVVVLVIVDIIAIVIAAAAVVVVLDVSDHAVDVVVVSVFAVVDAS